MRLAAIKPTYHMLGRKAIPPGRQILSGAYEKIMIPCDFLLPIFGSFQKPAKKGDFIVYWIDLRALVVPGNRLKLYASPKPDEIPEYMAVIWAAPIIGDSNKRAVLQLQNLMHALGNYPVQVGRLITISSTDFFQNTVGIGCLKEERTMNKFIVLWDYTALSVQGQLSIMSTIIKWHTSPKGPITLWKQKGSGLFMSDITDEQIESFVEEYHLRGLIWFIKGPHPKNGWYYSVVANGPSLIDPSMLIYTSSEFEKMLESYKNTMEDRADEEEEED